MTASAICRQYLRTLSYAEEDAEEETKLIAFFQAITKTTLLPHSFLLHSSPFPHLYSCSRLWIQAVIKARRI